MVRIAIALALAACLIHPLTRMVLTSVLGAVAVRSESATRSADPARPAR